MLVLVILAKTSERLWLPLLIVAALFFAMSLGLSSLLLVGACSGACG